MDKRVKLAVACPRILSSLAPCAQFCTECGIEKAVEEFYRAAARHDGHSCYCKSCHCTTINRKRAEKRNAIQLVPEPVPELCVQGTGKGKGKVRSPSLRRVASGRGLWGNSQDRVSRPRRGCRNRFCHTMNSSSAPRCGFCTESLSLFVPSRVGHCGVGV